MASSGPTNVKEFRQEDTFHVPRFEPQVFGDGAKIVYSESTRAPAETERLEERDPVTGETRTVERITFTSKNTYYALSENPQAFGADAAVMVGPGATVIGSSLKNLDPGLQAAILTGKFDYGQYMAEQRLNASGQATGSAANVPSQAPANGMNSSQTTNSFDQRSSGVDQTMRTLFGDQIDSSAQPPVSARHGPHPSHVGNTPWTGSQFVPRPFQAPEEHQGGMERPPMTTESVGNDVASQAELDEEERELQERFEALKQKKKARLMAVQQGKADQTTVTTLANPLQSLPPPPYTPATATSASTASASATGDRKAVAVSGSAEHMPPPVFRPGVF